MTYTIDDIKRRLVRYGDLIPCKTAFIDTRTPGSDQKENFTIIGPGVAESADQHVHVKIPHGFNIGGARQPKGCVNSQHSHETPEVFLVHSGVWAFRWGHDAQDGEAILHPGDVISIPVNVFRGFECLDGEGSFLFAILGGDDPGRVDWAPYVFEQAKGHGLVLTEGGELIDLAAGEAVPEGDKPCQPLSDEELKTYRRMTTAEMSERVFTVADQKNNLPTNLEVHSTGVKESPILGPENSKEKIAAGKFDDPHGFHFRKLIFQKGGRIPPHSRAEEEVVFVHKGRVTLCWDDHCLEMGEGDTFTTPKGLVHSWWNAIDTDAELFVIRGGDAPQGAQWIDCSLSGTDLTPAAAVI